MSFLTTARESLSRGLTRTFAQPWAYVAGEWERMAPRERRWVAALAVAILVVSVILGTYFVFSSISELEDGNADIREALSAIALHRDEYLDAKTRTQAQDARIGPDPPQLIADLEAAAREEQIKIEESNERPAVAAGKRYMEHDVDLRIREVDLQSLTKFLRRVETGPRLIVFTRLSLKRRYSEAEKLDAELTATAFERVREDVKTKKKPDGKDKDKEKEK
jgi:type II secretory pathway component PulM